MLIHIHRTISSKHNYVTGRKEIKKIRYLV